MARCMACVYTMSLYIGSNNNDDGIFKYDLSDDLKSSNGIGEGRMVLKNQHGPEMSRQVNSVSVYDNQIIFTDVAAMTVNIIGKDGNICRIAGTEGVGGFQDGHVGLLSQPTGLCVYKKRIFVVDTATASLRIIVPIHGMLICLHNLNTLEKVYGFSHDTTKEYSIEESCTMINAVDSFLKQSTEDLQNEVSVTLPEGPEGGFSNQTRKDITMLAENTKKLQQLVIKFPCNASLDLGCLIKPHCLSRISLLKCMK